MISGCSSFGFGSSGAARFSAMANTAGSFGFGSSGMAGWNPHPDIWEQEQAGKYIRENIFSVKDAILNARHENKFVREYCGKVLKGKKLNDDKPQYTSEAIRVANEILSGLDGDGIKRDMSYLNNIEPLPPMEPGVMYEPPPKEDKPSYVGYSGLSGIDREIMASSPPPPPKRTNFGTIDVSVKPKVVKVKKPKKKKPSKSLFQRFNEARKKIISFEEKDDSKNEKEIK